jgi:SpoVK/Ycf46/Vps4 family AAA+-type ATPase
LVPSYASLSPESKQPGEGPSGRRVTIPIWLPSGSAPADIEFAARRTAQLAFERVLFEQGKELVTTGDILHAISQTRRTLTPELVAEFEQDITEYARI